MGEIVAMQLRIENSCRGLEVWIKLELLDCHDGRLDEYVKELARRKAEANQIFTGRDLVATMCWMKTADDIPVIAFEHHGFADVEYVQQCMMGSLEEIEYPLLVPGNNYRRRLKIKLGNRHLAARAEIMNWRTKRSCAGWEKKSFPNSLSPRDSMFQMTV